MARPRKTPEPDPEPTPKPPPSPPTLRQRRRQQSPAAERQPLAEVLTEAKMLRVADAQSWRRGEEYEQTGAVVGLTSDEWRVMAIVRGTQPYEVTLAVTARGNIGYECTCPYHMDEGVFCKHCVAVGLAYLKTQVVEEIDVPVGSPMERIQTHLQGQSKEQLVTFLMAQALENEALRRRLLALAQPGGESEARPRLIFRTVA